MGSQPLLSIDLKITDDFMHALLLSKNRLLSLQTVREISCSRNGPFILFGLPENFTDKQVKKVYKQAMLIYHPDKFQITEDSDSDYIHERAAFITSYHLSLLLKYEDRLKQLNENFLQKIKRWIINFCQENQDFLSILKKIGCLSLMVLYRPFDALIATVLISIIAVFYYSINLILKIRDEI